MINNKIIVVFDFDGVVCDSTDECMVTSWNAWEKYNGRDNFRTDLAEFSREDKLNFRQVRPRVRGAGEYYILHRSFSESLDIGNQAAYDKLEKKWSYEITAFKKVFFKAREKLRKIDLEAWIDLHPVFDDVINVMKVLDRQNRLCIATLKDASVKLILSKQGLNIGDKNLLDQSKIKSKLEALDIFRRRFDSGVDDIVFIDDNVTHLIEPNNEGYEVYLATWGVQLEEYLHVAKEEKIKTLDQPQLLVEKY